MKAHLGHLSPADVDSRVSAVLASLSPTEDVLRREVESGTACVCRRDAWREIRGLRWLAGEDET
ncbi:hypothetical protein EV383_4346 [Pseudonocardia sediminis]|uniref:Uncharacterized protein n=1 Tax=Pseudonocardia sediminis TaxID=1397368 RepID=A0A4Q7V3Y4_PSEST|nr:hypothetical protein EV383_4346 [Pseudonocardia sediminis]